jgi:hypothetical protein
MEGALEVDGPRPLRGLFSIRSEGRAVPKSMESKDDSEPVGIVISTGSREEPTPAVFAYIWGPAPEAESESARVVAPRAA